jgi:prephenate dehydrogenase
VLAEDHFGTVAIVGVGLIGGSLGQALRRRGLARHVIGIGRNQKRLALALEFDAIDEATTDLSEGAAHADMIVLCTPVGKIIEDLGVVIAKARPSAVITDVGSVKAPIVAAAGAFDRFVGSHPMAGSEQTGVEAARDTLFEEATWAITPGERTDPEAVARVQRLAQSVGARTLILSPGDHDAAVAVSSHLPHVMASALIQLAARHAQSNPGLPLLCAGSFADATRVAASSSEMWRDICLANSTAVGDILKELEGLLATAREAVTGEDAEAVEKFFTCGRAAKKNWGRP